jgi:RNA polymerase sigma factor (sigma-70 family)
MILTHEDRIIVEWCVASTEEGAQLLVCRFSSKIMRWLERMNIPEADRPDVRQDIILDVLHQLGAAKFDARASLETWIYRITFVKSCDYWRLRNGRPRRALRSPVTQPTSDGACAWAGQEVEALLAEAMRRLPPRHAAAFRRFFLEDQDVEDVAVEIARSVSRTREILTEAKKTVFGHLSTLK